MAVPMTSYPDDSTVDDLLRQLSKRFFLDEPIAGNRLGDLLAEINGKLTLWLLDVSGHGVGAGSPP